MDSESVYKIKRIKWPPSSPSLVPILLQDINGPCPLLAIMNVLLLRQSIQLPAGAGEVTQVSEFCSIKTIRFNTLRVQRHSQCLVLTCY